jgi:hypothetical protein
VPVLAVADIFSYGGRMVSTILPVLLILSFRLVEEVVSPKAIAATQSPGVIYCPSHCTKIQSDKKRMVAIGLGGPFR